MAQARRLTIDQMRFVKRQLEEGQRSLADYLDPRNENCAVPASARELSENYLYSWVMIQIENSLHVLDSALNEGDQS